LLTDELVEILLRDIPPGDRWPHDFYSSYVKLFLGIFHRTCRDLNELRYVVCMKPVGIMRPYSHCLEFVVLWLNVIQWVWTLFSFSLTVFQNGLALAKQWLYG